MKCPDQNPVLATWGKRTNIFVLVKEVSALMLKVERASEFSWLLWGLQMRTELCCMGFMVFFLVVFCVHTC